MNVEKGDKWRCIKDVVMHPTGRVAFIKDKIYTAEYDERLTNEQGNFDHVVTQEEGFLDKYFQPYDCPRAIPPPPPTPQAPKRVRQGVAPTNERDTRAISQSIDMNKARDLASMNPNIRHNPFPDTVLGAKIGTKETDGKLDYEIDFEFITQMAERMAVNKGKYEPYNWQRIQDLEKLKQALFRHVMKVMNGEYDDEGRDFGHLEAIALNVMFLNYQLKNKK